MRQRPPPLAAVCMCLLTGPHMQADGSNIPLVVSANFSYSFLPSEVNISVT